MDKIKRIDKRRRKEEGNNNKNIEKYDEICDKKRLKLMFFVLHHFSKIFFNPLLL